MTFGLKKQTISKLQDVFKQFPEIEEVVIYGSRAKGNFKNGSDIDLTLIGNNIDQHLCDDIAEALDELLLPQMIDLSVFELLNHTELMEHIKRVGQVFYQKTD
ncbi:nucleotidyltransferase domain-containing protein [Deltaproteobacteria bacterium]|nr:nucleotidyltransferase domain-containing protein [Deltaproteobacteria bacterium]